jgi:hypothetical protein
VKGVTAAKTLQAQPDSGTGAIEFHGFLHVDGTGGMEAAGGGEDGGEEAFVEAEGCGDAAGGEGG